MAFLVKLGAQAAGAVGINLGTQLMRCSSCDHHAQVEVNKYVNEDSSKLANGADCPRCKAKNTVGVSDTKTGAAFEGKMKDVCPRAIHASNVIALSCCGYPFPTKRSCAAMPSNAQVCSKIRLFKNYNGRILVVRPGGVTYYL